MALFEVGNVPSPNAGRPKGTPNKITRELRALMEEDTQGLPVPVLLLRLGLRYEAEDDRDHAIAAIIGAMKMAYPSLKAIELTGEIVTIPVIPVQGLPPLV